MGEDFFKYLPSEIKVDIFSRLPAQAAMICKCVCKSWLSLLATHEFVNSHMSRSVQGIAVETHSNSYEVIEFVDELGFNFDEENHGGVAFNFDEEYQWYAAFNFKLPFDEPIHSSANGLIFLRGVYHGDLILCNPVTSDYIKLPSPRQTTSKDQDQLVVESFGFGVSRTTGQYKVVRVFEEKPLKDCPLQCQVYTVGTGIWRKVPSGCLHMFFDERGSVHFNGNLHWMVVDKITDKWKRVEQICCLDLETELFSHYSAPYPHPCVSTRYYYLKTPCVLRDCLCLCCITNDFEIEIWSMEEYGDEKSWTMKVLFDNVFRGCVVHHACPIKLFENGDILMEFDGDKLLYYTNKTQTFYDFFIREDKNAYISTTMYAPSFLTLKNFAMENVSSF